MVGSGVRQRWDRHMVAWYRGAGVDGAGMWGRVMVVHREMLEGPAQCGSDQGVGCNSDWGGKALEGRIMMVGQPPACWHLFLPFIIVIYFDSIYFCYKKMCQIGDKIICHQNILCQIGDKFLKKMPPKFQWQNLSYLLLFGENVTNK